MLTQARFDAPAGVLEIKMVDSDATAKPLLKHGCFGADIIRFPPNGKIADHIHPGSHMLFVLSGFGWVDYEGVPTRLKPGVCYLIPAGIRHGIRATTELTLLAVGDDHREAGAAERLTLCE